MKKSNVIGLTIGIIIVIVAVSLISWFAIKPVPNFIQGEVEATRGNKYQSFVESTRTYRTDGCQRGPKGHQRATTVHFEHARSAGKITTGPGRS